jgi:hypothetical protein
MAAQITHIIAGEEALRRALTAEAEPILAAAGRWFRLGCQGPDIFYHNQRTKPSGLHYGSLAHRRDYGTIVEAAASALPAGSRDAATPSGAYLLGMATHAALDRATHPFIVCFSGWEGMSGRGGEVPARAHPFLERLLDVAYLDVTRGIAPSGFDFSRLLPLAGGAAPDADPGTPGAIAALWAEGLRAAYPRAAGRDTLLGRRIGNALADALRFLFLTNPAAAADSSAASWFLRLDGEAALRSVALLYPETVPSDIDVMNLAHAPWPHPSGDGRGSSASYTELVEEGIEAAAVAIRAVSTAFEEGLPREEIALAVGTGGLVVADAGGIAVRPKVASPLPLAAPMAAELRRRLALAGTAAAN